MTPLSLPKLIPKPMMQSVFSLKIISRTSRYLLGAVFVCFLCGDAVLKADEAGGQKTTHDAKVRVLLITGGCCHDYQNQKKLIRTGLTKQLGSIDWTILEYGSQRDLKVDIYERADWITGFDLIIHNECFGGVEDADFVRGIVKGHVDHGVPAIMIHCSMHSYRNSSSADSWRSLVGVTSRRHERAKRSLKVEATDAGERFGIADVIGGGWDTPNGELYIIEQVWPKTVVLADSYSPETMKREPVIWINEHQGVKVFGISLGHHNETIQAEQWQQIVAKGFSWALGR